jgi:hypothetical protein
MSFSPAGIPPPPHPRTHLRVLKAGKFGWELLLVNPFGFFSWRAIKASPADISRLIRIRTFSPQVFSTC